mgnify:CR=1 FL=1
MLNCLPRTIMWGEHNGALKPLLSSYSRLRNVADNKFVARAANLLQPVYDREPILSKPGMSIEWLNWFSGADIDKVYRECITGLFYPDAARQRFSRWGFKEIQYREEELHLLRKLFPDMRTIILYRNPAAVFASQFKHFARSDGERIPKILKNIEGYYMFAAQQASEMSAAENPPLLISYEEIVGDFDASVLKLEGFLDEKFSSAIAELGQDIKRFCNRRNATGWKGSPLEDFKTWQAATKMRLPPKKLQLIAGYYDTLVNTTMASPEAGTELAASPGG